MTRMPTYYISHGGGPCFWMEYGPPIGPGGFDRLRDFLADIPNHLQERPKAILLISAHWETDIVSVSTKAAPGMLYDYRGFPAHTYELQHPAPGNPELAARVLDLLASAGIEAKGDATRDYDHGVFVPMKIIDPDASIPIVMVSLRADLDPQFHIDVGHALTPLRDEGVLIIGSGSSFHDLRSYFDGKPGGVAAFDDWLVQTALDPSIREARLADWTSAPSARECHPREEHLLPLMVAAGAAVGDAGHHAYKDVVANKPFSGFAFG